MVPTVILTTTGSQSGQLRTVPLACVPRRRPLRGRQQLRAGAPPGVEHLNLVRTPRARASFEGDDYDVVAHLLSPDDKAETWPRLIAVWPAYDNYVERSGRDLRVFRLDRVGGEPSLPASDSPRVGLVVTLPGHGRRPVVG